MGTFFSAASNEICAPGGIAVVRRAKRAVIAIFLALAVCFVAPTLLTVAAQGQQSTPQSGASTVAKPGAADGVWSPALTGVRRPLYRLRASDQVEVKFIFSPEFDQSVMVQPDGYIPLRGTGQIYVEGASVPELQEAIRMAYAGILHDPEVSVTLKDFDKPYFIAAGELGHPGKYELRSDTTVTEAVAIAGGFTPRAKHSQVVLFRRVSDELVESHLLNMKEILKSKDLGEDIHLRPGDLLFVPQNLISKLRQFLPASSISMYASSAQF